ncbi:hypothetical protein VPH35_110644 [Triticum aestivum]
MLCARSVVMLLWNDEPSGQAHRHLTCYRRCTHLTPFRLEARQSCSFDASTTIHRLVYQPAAASVIRCTAACSTSGEGSSTNSQHPAPGVEAWRALTAEGGEIWQDRRPAVGSSEKRVKDRWSGRFGGKEENR